jgi:hypothetical protein
LKGRGGETETRREEMEHLELLSDFPVGAAFEPRSYDFYDFYDLNGLNDLNDFNGFILL